MGSSEKLTEIIKKHIDLRGKDVPKLAEMIGVKTSTLYDKLHNNRISVEDLFKISIALDINLEWLKDALGYSKNSGSLKPIEVLRMSEDYRNAEIPKVKQVITRCYHQFPQDLTSIRSELKSTYKTFYYILDVMLPEDFRIFTITERNTISFWVLSPEPVQRKGLQTSLENGTNVLNEIILNVVREMLV